MHLKETSAIIAERQRHPQLPFALATVVGVTGSSYRRPGARMLVGRSGRVAGSVSGGCLEGDVILHAQRVMDSETRHVVRYDTANEADVVFGTGLGCRGQIEILIEPLPPGRSWPLEEAVARVVATRKAECLVTFVQAAAAGVPVPASTSYPHRQTVSEAGGTSDVFVERIEPPPSLVIFGGGPDAPPLVRIAQELGYHVTVVDRRRAVARNCAGADKFLCARPAQIVGELPWGTSCAVVVMNHHLETDQEALESVLPHAPRYVGMLGPRERTDRILDALANRGIDLSADDLERLHAPAGLDLGSSNPEQIALSILAEIQASFSGRSAGKLRARPGPINARQSAA